MKTLNDIVLPVEFSGDAQFILFNRYGDPRDTGWDNKWLTTWHVREAFSWFPQPLMLIHKHFWPLLASAFEDLQRSGLHKEIATFDGCYELRTITGGDKVLSTHCWGASIDLNALDNPIGSRGNWSLEFIEVMQQNNIFCGQVWDGRKDPMHFSMVNG
jgi:hypothetical protein